MIEAFNPGQPLNKDVTVKESESIGMEFKQ